MIAVALTHGAGSDSGSPLLAMVASELERARAEVHLYDLPYRRERASGPPRAGDAGRDRAGIRETLVELRAAHPGAKLIAGGHSYGGRQSSMLAAEEPGLLEGLMLLSYPLHPPRKREQLRTAHLTELRTPAFFIHGTRDPFGSPEEMEAALALIAAPSRLHLVEGGGHELVKARGDWAAQAVAAALGFFTGE